MKTKTIKCSFDNSRGQTIDARLDLPAANGSGTTQASEVKAFIVFCHCFTCSKETITTFRLSRLLAASGYGVLRFDFSGLGDSEGDFADTTFNSMLDDLESAIDFLALNYRTADFLIGHSLGGTAALAVAQKNKNIRAAVTIASPSQPDHVLHHFGHALTMLEQNIAASFEVAGQYYDIKPGFVEDIRNIDMRSRLDELDKPVLVFNIENDALVAESNAREIQQWVKGEVTLINVSRSNHLLSDKQAIEKVAGDIDKWIERIG